MKTHEGGGPVIPRTGTVYPVLVKLTFLILASFVADVLIRDAIAAESNGAARVAVPPPNLVLILLDDVGYSDYGCFGSEIETPNMDRLARGGLTFTQFYNNAVCHTTRASLLTGLFPRHVGPTGSLQLTPQMWTLGELLDRAGYRTFLSGKWHLGRTAPHHPNDRGFSEYFGLLDGCSNHFDAAIPDPPFEGGRVRVWSRNRDRILKFPADFYSSDAIANHAIENIRRSVAEGRPFFSHICFTAAHSPLHAKPADIDKYRGKYHIGWNAIRKHRRERQLASGLIDARWGESPKEPEFPDWHAEPLPDWNANLMAVYAAMIDSMDQNIGRVLETLETTGVLANTIVMVLNDNGGCAEQAGGDDPANIAGPKDFYVSCGAGWAWAQNTPFRRYKGWVHEGGIATPLIVSWPKVVPAGQRSNAVGHLIDIVPTVLELTNSEYPRTRNGIDVLPLEGRSLAPLVLGKSNDELPPRGTIFWKCFDNRAVRQDNWKLVRDETIGRWELYDLASDRTELHDRANDFPDRVVNMEFEWNKWAERTGAIRYQPEPYRLKRNPTNLRPIKIALIGDSTMASYPNPPQDRPTLTGWGQVLDKFFEKSVTISNRAVSGRSSKSFLREGRWEPVLAEKPDFVFIQFGHNDQPGKEDRTTDPERDFPDNLAKYIADARAIGAQPILVTPVARRTYSGQRAHTTLTPYVDATLKVARDSKVPVIDLHAMSFKLFDELGDEATAHFSPSAGDRTHFSRRSAMEIAKLVVTEASQSIGSLRPYLRQPWHVAF